MLHSAHSCSGSTLEMDRTSLIMAENVWYQRSCQSNKVLSTSVIRTLFFNFFSSGQAPRYGEGHPALNAQWDDLSYHVAPLLPIDRHGICRSRSASPLALATGYPAIPAKRWGINPVLSVEIEEQPW